jgi:hypothetical protein
MRAPRLRILAHEKAGRPAGKRHIAQPARARPVRLTGKKNRPRRHADRKIGDRRPKTHAPLRKTIHIGRANHGISVTPHLKGTQLIARAQQDVREFFHFSVKHTPFQKRIQ